MTDGHLEMARLRRALKQSYVPATLGHLLAQCVNRDPDRVFGNWFDQGKTLTYAELDSASARLASALVRRGVRKGTHVAFFLLPGPEQAITWFALARIGAVSVPVNNRYQAAELSYVVNDSDAQYLVVSDSLLTIYRKAAADMSLLQPKNVFVAGQAPDDLTGFDALLAEGDPVFVPAAPVYPGDLLNIQYTSGTTGFPKGCMLTHEYMDLFAHSAAQMHGSMGEIRNILVWAPMHYIDGLSMTLMTAVVGGTVFYPDRMSLTRLLDWLETYDINVATIPAAAVKMMKDEGYCRRLNLVSVSAFNWSDDLRREFAENLGNIARNGFGMTEVGVTTFIPSSEKEKALGPSLGIEAAFNEVMLVDDDGNPVARGQVGEMWIKGRGVFLGYYKKPDANAENFDGAWFKTGDLFRQDEDGYFYIVGRKKEMIKRAGENIAAREVEAVLCELDAVQEAAVISVPDELRKEEVKAYLMLRAPHTPDQVTSEVILDHCRSRLAAFKLPRYITYVQDFPHTPTGKIRKTELIPEGGNPFAEAFDCVEGVWR